MQDVDSVAPYPCRNPVAGNFFCSSRMITGAIRAESEENRLLSLRSGRYLSATMSRTIRINIGGAKSNSRA